MYCKNCGKKLTKKGTFCGDCGVKVEENNNNEKCVTSNNINNKSGLKTASIVLGIIGIVGAILVMLSPLSFILSLIGLILGICATKKVKNVSGIILNVIGLLLSLIMILLVVFGIGVFTSFMNETNYDPDSILFGESITIDDIYNGNDGNISLDVILNEVDKLILEEMYPEDEDMLEEIDDTVEYYYSTYEQYYGYTKDEFLSAYSFNSEEDFVEYLKLDYLRNEYYEDYVEEMITEKEIDKYYKDKVYGDVDSKHILVQVGEDGFTDEEAKKLAYEIINELDTGKTWDKVIEEYKDDIINEELGYYSFNAPLESSYLDECRNLEVGEYSKTPVLTDYGYHIVYKIEQKDKPNLKDVRDEIVEALVNEKMQEDENLYYKALIYMREEAGLNLDNTLYNDDYEEYIETYK